MVLQILILLLSPLLLNAKLLLLLLKILTGTTTADYFTLYKEILFIYFLVQSKIFSSAFLYNSFPIILSM